MEKGRRTIVGTAEPQARRKSETHLDFRFRIFTLSDEIMDIRDVASLGKYVNRIALHIDVTQ